MTMIMLKKIVTVTVQKIRNRHIQQFSFFFKFLLNFDFFITSQPKPRPLLPMVQKFFFT